MVEPTPTAVELTPVAPAGGEQEGLCGRRMHRREARPHVPNPPPHQKPIGRIPGSLTYLSTHLDQQVAFWSSNPSAINRFPGACSMTFHGNFVGRGGQSDGAHACALVCVTATAELTPAPSSAWQWSRSPRPRLEAAAAELARTLQWRCWSARAPACGGGRPPACWHGFGPAHTLCPHAAAVGLTTGRRGDDSSKYNRTGTPLMDGTIGNFLQVLPSITEISYSKPVVAFVKKKSMFS
jgi:hypothetical protein